MSHTVARETFAHARERDASTTRIWDGGSETTLKQAAPGAYHLVWISALLLLAAGLCMVLSVSVATGVIGEDKYQYFRPQAIGAAVGLVLLWLVSRLDYRRLRATSMILLGFMALVLLLVHVPHLSYSEGGSSSWFKLGPVTFQPSEFAKLAIVMAGAHLLSLRRVRPGDSLSYLLPYGAAGVIMCGLVALEGDLGTAIIIAGLLLGLLWIGGMRGGHLLMLGGTMGAAAAAFIFTSSERTSRILAFLRPSADLQGAGYQLYQSMVALGRGGWLGVGPGESVQKFQYLPEAHTDMIYSILGEEFGLLGTTLVVGLFVVFAMACWQLARRCGDPMGKYLLAGCGMLVTLQAAVNIGGVVGAMPLTGVPLPFISYGRNSLIVMLMAVGLVLAVARRATVQRPPIPAERYDNVTRIDRRRRNGGARSARTSAG